MDLDARLAVASLEKLAIAAGPDSYPFYNCFFNRVEPVVAPSNADDTIQKTDRA